MSSITKIKNISHTTYNGERETSAIRYIVVAMTNDLHSGYAYARSYKDGLKNPKFSYNYVVDKTGKIYQAIEDTKIAFSIKTSDSTPLTDNNDVLSICMMPTWQGESGSEYYDSGNKFPENPEKDEYFILTKERTIGGTKYVVGLYMYNGTGWQLQEELTSTDVKRPMDSEKWTFEQETEESALYLIKWLQYKYNITDNRILRVYDFYKTYNPAPYIYEEGSEWEYFKSRLTSITLEDVKAKEFKIIPEAEIDINEEILKNNPDKSKTEIIEEFGPDAGLYVYKCMNTGTCPYWNKKMYGEICTLSGWDEAHQTAIKECKYRTQQAKKSDDKFSPGNGNACVDISTMPGNKFTFSMGIHNTLTTQNVRVEGNEVKSDIVGTIWDISEVVQDITWDSHLEGSVGELSFTFVNKDNKVDMKEGYNVGYIINDIPSFNGNTFKISQSGNSRELLKCTCYDNFKYLNNQGFNSFVGKTASQIFEEVCTLLGLRHIVLTPSSFVVRNMYCYGTTYYDMLTEAINETIVAEGKWYIIQDNFGVLQFRDILDTTERDMGNFKIGSNIKQLKFSEDSAIINWDFDTDIEDSANVIFTYVKGKQDEGDDKKVTISSYGTAKDESSIQEWGKLIKVFEVPDKLTQGQVQQQAELKLKHWNSPRRTLKLSCVGIAGMMAGNIIYVEIYDVVSVGKIRGCLVVDDCTHRISNGKWQMDLTCEIVQDRTLADLIYNAVDGAKEGTEEKKEETLESNTEQKEKTLDDYNNVIAPIIIWATTASLDRTKLNDAIYELIRHGEINLYWSNFIIQGNKYDYTKLAIFTTLTDSDKQNAITYIKATYDIDKTIDEINQRVAEISFIYGSCVAQNQATVEATKQKVAELDTTMQEKHDTEAISKPIGTDKSDVTKTIIATSSEAEKTYKESQEYKDGLSDGSIEVKRSDIFTTNTRTSMLDQLKQKTSFAGYSIDHIWQDGNKDVYKMSLTIDGRCIWVCFGGNEISDFSTFEEAETAFNDFYDKVQQRKLWSDATIKAKIDNAMGTINSLIGTSWTETSSYTMTSYNFIKQKKMTYSGDWIDIKGAKAMPATDVFHFMKKNVEVHKACEGMAHKLLDIVFGEGNLLFEDNGWGTFGDISNEVRIGDCIGYKPPIGNGHIEFIKAIQDGVFSVISGNVTIINGTEKERAGKVKADTYKRSYYTSGFKKNSYISCTHIPIEL